MRKRAFMTLYGPLEIDARVLRSIKALENKGYDVLIVDTNTARNFKLPNNVKQINLKLSGIGLLSYFAFCIKCVIEFLKNKNSYDIIYLHDFYAPLIGIMLSFCTELPIIYDAHELILKRKKDKVSFRDKFFIYLEKLFVRKAKYIIAANDERALVMRRFYHINNVIGVMNITKQKISDLNRKIKNERISIVYQGYLSEGRKLSFFIKALCHLPRHIVLTFIGDGPAMESYKNLASDLGVADRIEFTGQLSNLEMMNKLKNCNIGIISYSFNNLNNIYCSPNKIFEYTANRLPFIGTSQPFIEKISKYYAIGETFKTDNIDSFVQGIMKITDNYDSYQNGMNQFLSDYNYDSELNKIMNII